MNCNNCPALEPYKATTVLGTSNCTFDPWLRWPGSSIANRVKHSVRGMGRSPSKGLPPLVSHNVKHMSNIQRPENGGGPEM